MTKPRPLLRLILGDQLNPLHSWFDRVRPDVVYVLLETRSETDYVLHHGQKVLGIFAAMRDLARHLGDAGHRVHHLPINHPENRQGITVNLDALVEHYHAVGIEYQAPDEWRLDRELADWSQQCPVPVTMTDSEHFYTTRDAARELFKGRSRWLMETFYRQQRRAHGVLMTPEGTPAGGQWNYDAENRMPWRGSPEVPADSRPCHDHSALWQAIIEAGVRTMGNPQAGAFRWPLNRGEALRQLDHFVSHCLPHFGKYQDALSQQSWHLFHSLLSFALNTKMLNPREVVSRAERAWQAGEAALPAVEGFIRQILGWREYVRGVYWAQMPGYTKINRLGHRRPLPQWFWTGNTRMACMAQAIGLSLKHAYAHHIQRLMVIGNFALLAGLDTEELHRWYLGIYIDAFEWVEAPNTLGMSQFADGGQLATKPYVSSSAYLARMGDHCSTCHYKPREKTGPRACPFNSLYWAFFDRHRVHLQSNPRLGIVYRQISNLSPDAINAMRQHANTLLDGIQSL